MLKKELKGLIIIALPVVALFLSCSSNTEKEHEAGSLVHTKKISGETDRCGSFLSIVPDKDFNVFRRTPVSIHPGNIKDMERYQELDKAFYDRYLAGSDLIHDWIGESGHPPDLQTDHYFWGMLEMDNDLCQFIVYEHFSYNGNEDKLILINLDENGEVIDTKIIAGRVSSPGADIKYSSKIWKDRFHVFITEKGTIDRKGGKYKYQKDSVVLKYKLTGQRIELTGKDSLRDTYWE